MRKNFAPAHFMEGFKPFTVRAMRSNIGAMRSNIGAMRSKLGAMRSNFGAICSKLGAMRSNIGAMRSNIGAMRSKLGAMRSKLGAMRSNIGAMRSKLILVSLYREPVQQAVSTHKFDSTHIEILFASMVQYFGKPLTLYISKNDRLANQESLKL